MWPANGAFEVVGEIAKASEKSDISKLPFSPPHYLVTNNSLVSSRDVFYLRYEDGKVTTRPKKLTKKEGLNLVAYKLPNGVMVRKHFGPGTYEFDRQGNIIRPKPEELKKGVVYHNPKISLSLGKGMYLVIPKNANWDKIVKGVIVSDSGETEFIGWDKLKDAIAEKKEGVYPLPADAYSEDRSGLEKLLFEANKLERAGNLLSALTKYQDMIDAYPQTAIPYHNMGVLHLQTGKLDLAIRSFERVFDKDPDYKLERQTHLNLGNAYIQKGMTEEAEKEFQKALEITPNCSDALYSLGALEFNERKNYQRALRYWEILKDIDKDYPELKRIEDMLKLK